MILLKLFNIKGIFKLFLTVIIYINAITIYSQDANRRVKLDFLSKENTYYPAGNKVNLKVIFERIDKGDSLINHFEFEYKKRKFELAFIIIDSVLYAIDKNKIIEICNKKFQKQEVLFNNYKIEVKLNKNSNYPHYEIVLKSNKQRFFDDFYFIKLLVSLIPEDLVIITAQNKKDKLFYDGEM